MSASLIGAALSALCVLLGAALVAGTLRDIFLSVIVPRPSSAPFRPSSFISRRGWQLWRRLAHRFNDAGRREEFLGIFAPAMLVALSVIWLGALVVGYGTMFYGLRDQTRELHSYGDALYFAGTTALTIGYGDVVPTGPATRVLSIIAGATGFGVFAVVTTFLFAIFGSFQSREAFIITFGNRSGAPPSAVDAILGAAKLGTLDRVLEIGESAQVWMAQVLETHLAYPVLIFFRSTHDGLSWVGTLGGLLDSATLVLTTLDHPQSGDAALLLRLGRHVVDDISDYFDLVDTGATGIERSEFYQAYETFRAAGLRLRNRDAAWDDFSRTRAGYASRLNQMATFLSIPPQQWVSDRSLLIARRRPILPVA
ncbi:MAG: potassium channel family protein [Candidatus Velthaea sp.]